MFPLIVGFGSALLFGVFAYGMYGIEGTTGYAWIGMVLWALVVGATLVFLVNQGLPCWVCRFKERVRAIDRWCRDLAPCA